MILQELKKYYDKKNSVTSGNFASEGFEPKEIPFLVVIDREGNLVNLQDTRKPVQIPVSKDEKTGEMKYKTKLQANSYNVPRSVPRSGSRSYAVTFLLWDHIGYLFGYPETDEKSPKQYQVWLDSLRSLPDKLKDDEGVAAIIKFYEKNGVENVKKHQNWLDCTKIKSCNVTFILNTDLDPIPCRDVIKEYLKTKQISEQQENDSSLGICLITGNHDKISRIFHSVSLGGNQAKLVCFQKNSGYDSYGKEQGANAPIGEKAQDAFTDALRHLLNSEQCIRYNETSYLFWAETPNEYEGYIVNAFNDDPDKRTEAVTALLNALKSGSYVEDTHKKRFFILGLNPNKARIAVKLWICNTVGGLADNIRQHFEDTKIQHSTDLPDTLSLKQLLKSLVLRRELKNLPVTLESEVLFSILEGQPYPVTLLQSAIRRIRADHASKEDKMYPLKYGVTYPRAAIIKAYLNRLNPEEIKEMLDLKNMTQGYRLGRLFAVLEKIQSEANPGINATIRDRFYGAASGTPAIVFPNLMRLKNHHLSKLEHEGRRINLERLLGEVIEGIPGVPGEFPSFLNMRDQGRFAVGYYHQMQDFFKKKEKTGKSADHSEMEVAE